MAVKQSLQVRVVAVQKQQILKGLLLAELLTSYQWHSARPRAGRLVVRVPVGTRNFSLNHCVQTGSGAHPASYPIGTRGSIPGGKEAGAWSLPLTSVWCRGQRMSGAIHPLPQYSFMAWCSVKNKKHRDFTPFTFTIISHSNWFILCSTQMLVREVISVIREYIL
jgi:hypothetical protein